jgi:beta-lactamase class A
MPVDLQELDALHCQFALYSRLRGQPALFHANCERFSAASLIKVPILLAWVILERSGQVDQAEYATLDASAAQGEGFSNLFTCRRLPFHDILLMMIALSDNLCTNLVIRRIGLGRLNQIFREDLGLLGTEINREMLDFDARRRGLDNWITAQDCIHLFDLLHNLDEPELAWVEPILRSNQDDLLLLRELPGDSLTFYHKTGSLPGLLHDWGYTRSCDLFLLTQNFNDIQGVYRIFGKLGRLLVADEQA